ncbi:lachesin-like [Crassostrea angulata]|uniref:lachesin-like n=1 Tax=Magallana angulata TaxID=2784310 RepID=UPI0022B1D7FA|nr:lachesin-like [Crassostrea angulata]
MYACICFLALSSVIHAEPELVIYELGDNLKYPLYCRVNDISKSSWKRSDVPISAGGYVFDFNKYSLDDRSPPEYNLKLKKSLLKNDAGKYSCTEGREEIKSYILIAKESASIPKHSESSIYSMLGETVKLWCNATGYPEPTVTWYACQQTRYGEKLESIGISGNMLGIRNISRNCNTIYQCQAINSYRMKKPVAKNITLRVHFFPDVFVGIKLNDKEISNSGFIFGRKKDRLALSCSVYAVPPANVAWSRDNITIGTYHHVNGIIEKSSNADNFLYGLTKALEIKIGISVTMDFTLDADNTFASYHCDAKNEVGYTRKTVKIKHVQKR